MGHTQKRRWKKQYKHTQKAGVRILPTALATMAYLSTPYGQKGWENALFTKKIAPRFEVPSFQPTYTPTALMPMAYPSAVSIQNNQRFPVWKVPEISRRGTASARASVSTTSSPMPAPAPQIKTFAKTPTGLLKTASETFLRNTANVTQEIIQETVAQQPLGKGITIAGHNTLTTSTTKVLGIPIVSVNQQLSLDQYLEHCAVTNKCFLDIDMWQSGGKIISSHGGPMRGFERVINTSPNAQNTPAILQKIHSFAASHPNVTFTIRVENHDVGPRDIESMMTPAMKSQVATFSKHAIPTHGELTSSGTNVCYFIENTSATDVNPETGVCTGSLAMAQDNYFVRTNWNDIKGLTNTDDIKGHLIYDPAKLPAKPMILVDGYNTAVGADVSALPTQSSFVATVTQTTLPKIKEAMASEGLDVADSGCVIMMDFVNSDAFSYQVALDFVQNIPDPQTRGYVETYMPPVFVELQTQIYKGLQQGAGNTIKKMWNTSTSTEIALGSMSCLCFLFAMGALAKKFFQKGKRKEAKDIDQYVEGEVYAHPELQPIWEESKQKGSILDTLDLDAIPFVDDPSSRLESGSTPHSNGSEPSSPTSILNNMPPLESNVRKLSRSEKRRRRRNRQEEEAFLKWGMRRKGGKTQRKRLQ